MAERPGAQGVNRKHAPANQRPLVARTGDHILTTSNMFFLEQSSKFARDGYMQRLQDRALAARTWHCARVAEKCSRVVLRRRA